MKFRTSSLSKRGEVPYEIQILIELMKSHPPGVMPPADLIMLLSVSALFHVALTITVGRQDFSGNQLIMGGKAKTFLTGIRCAIHVAFNREGHAIHPKGNLGATGTLAAGADLDIIKSITDNYPIHRLARRRPLEDSDIDAMIPDTTTILPDGDHSLISDTEIFSTL